ncbi:C1q-related factor-like [Mercenaria mercenaria]|uniref:C1q-related factor-like n=1 Tax=Mercenaria mercenaria TaxID=6596 RepID=UPI00234EA4FE|nr:C1q-related factor-like [Mercenaria mercenaria]
MSKYCFNAKLTRHVASMDEGQTIRFTADLNKGNQYSNGTGVFTAPVEGWYSFSFSVAHKSHRGSLSVHLLVSGTASVGATAHQAPAGQNSQASNEAIIRMTAGDVAQVVVSDSATDVIADGYTSFSGFLLYSD